MNKSTIHRIVTGHNPEGKSAILFDEHSELRPGFASESCVLWQSHEAPANLDGHEDLADEKAGMHAAGSLIRVVDFPPRSEGVSHRTRSLDYGIVLEGELEMVLSDGSRTTVSAGDVVVQRAVSFPSLCPQSNVQFEDLFLSRNASTHMSCS